MVHWIMANERMDGMTSMRKRAVLELERAEVALAGATNIDERLDAMAGALVAIGWAMVGGREEPQNETNSVSPVREPVCEHFHLTKTDDGWILQRGDWPPIELADDDQLFYYIAAARNRAVYGEWMQDGK